MDGVWFAAAGVALVGWAVGRSYRSLSKTRANAKKAKPAQQPVTVPPTIPSFVDVYDEDEIDVTLVTASPLQGASAIRDPGEELAESTGPRRSSTVNLKYEEQAEPEEVTSPQARILISAEAQSDCGRVRECNEDSVLTLPEFSLYAVADGMGGYEGGELASSLAVETLRTAYETACFEGSLSSGAALPRRARELACAIQMANQAIMASAARDSTLAEMGTTLVAARFSPNKQRVYIGHVGDSRCYRLRGNALRQLTSDHTLSQLGIKGPGAKRLFQAVGQKAEISIDLLVDRPQPQDTYLLCSDGLSKMVPDQQIREVLSRERDLPAAARMLVELANRAGGKDNVTVVLVRVVQLPTLLA
jgi:protein phosphatase